MKLGIDLGGTKIEIVALGEMGNELLRRRTPTPRGDYEATLESIAGLITEAEAELGRRGTIGIGTPGAISRATGLLRNSNSIHLNDRPIHRDLEALLQRPIRIANDANCFALSEATDGAAAGSPVVFGVIVGTGTGAGIVVNGHVLTGPNAIAGEWGHNPLPWPREEENPGPECYCGKRGCIETWLSGPGMARDHERATGECLDPVAVAARAARGDAACEATLSRYEDRMARALAHVINILDPDVIVLGGGMSNIDRLYHSVPLLWRRHVFSDRVDTRLVRNRHGDSSGVRGAAWLAD
jgi:fructokinase